MITLTLPQHRALTDILDRMETLGDHVPQAGLRLYPKTLQQVNELIAAVFREIPAKTTSQYITRDAILNKLWKEKKAFESAEGPSAAGGAAR